MNVRRLILVDQTLENFQGHHYEYAAAVAKAAADRGLQCRIWAHRAWPADARVGEAAVEPVFSSGWAQPAPASHPSRSPGLIRASIAKLRSSTQKTLSRAFNDSAVWAPAYRGIRSAYQLAASLLSPTTSSPCAEFAEELRMQLHRSEVSSGDLVFVPTLSVEEFAASLPVVASLDSPPVFQLIFRRDPDETSIVRSSRGSLRSLLASARGLPFRYYTDTEELTEAYSRMGERFSTLPIPIIAERFAKLSRSPGDATRITYLGDARLEKGFHRLPRLVRALLEVPGVEFHIQCNAGTDPSFEDGEVRKARQELKSLSDPRVRLYDHALSPDAYLKLLADSDIVLIPYQAGPYRYRSSGILAEALAAGKPSVVPSGTWMSRQIAPGLGLSFKNDRELERVVRQLVSGLSDFSLRCRAHRTNWLKLHSAETLVSQLLEAESR